MFSLKHPSDHPIRLMVILLVMICGLVAPVAAQEPAWTALVYRYEDGTLTRVAEDGRIITQVTLPRPEGYDLYGQTVAGHPGYPHVLYRVSTADRLQYRYIVYNYETDSIYLEYDVTQPFAGIPDTLANFQPGNLHFSSGYVVIGIGLFDLDWEILVFDMDDGSLVHRLDQTAPVLTLQLSHPTIFDFQYPEVTFAFFNPGESPDLPTRTYVWHVLDQTIRDNPFDYNRNYAYSAAEGVRLIAGRESSLPASDNIGGSNAVQLYRTGPLPVTVYNDDEIAIQAAVFIEDNSHLLVRGFGPGGSTVWRVVTRNGQRVRDVAWNSPWVNAIAGVPDGFVFTESHEPALYYVRTRDVAGNSPLDAVVLGEYGDQLVSTWPQPDEIEATPWANLTTVPVWLYDPRFIDPDPVWQAWLAVRSSYPETLMLVNDSGQVAGIHTLPRPADMPLARINSPHIMDLSGQYVAYTLGPDDQPWRLYVYDLHQRRVVVDYPLPAGTPYTSLAYDTGLPFSADSTAFVLGYQAPDGYDLIRFSLTDDAVSYDAVSSSVRHQLSLEGALDDAVILEPDGIDPSVRAWLTPHIVRVTGDDILFAIGWPADNPFYQPQSPLMRWVPGQGVEVVPAMLMAGYAVLPTTGEIASPAIDDAWPRASQGANIITLYDPATGQQNIIFHSGEYEPEQVYFTRGGETLFMRAFHPQRGEFDQLALARGQSVPERWFTTLDQVVNDLQSTADGLLFAQDCGLYRYDTQTATLTDPVFALNCAYMYLLNAWEADPAGAPATAWPPLDTSSIAQAGADAFVLGSQMVITPAGNQVRVRTEPTTSAQVLRQLNQEVRVTLVGGPVRADGYTWWQVRHDESGDTGWIVQNVGGDDFLAAP